VGQRNGKSLFDIDHNASAPDADFLEVFRPGRAACLILGALLAGMGSFALLKQLHEMSTAVDYDRGECRCLVGR
jgi:hypothetical protein